MLQQHFEAVGDVLYTPGNTGIGEEATYTQDGVQAYNHDRNIPHDTVIAL